MGATIPNIHLLTDAKVLGPLLKEGIDNLLGLLLLDYSRGRCHLLALRLLSFRLQARNILCIFLPPKPLCLEKVTSPPWKYIYFPRHFISLASSHARPALPERANPSLYVYKVYKPPLEGKRLKPA